MLVHVHTKQERNKEISLTQHTLLVRYIHMMQVQTTEQCKLQIKSISFRAICMPVCSIINFRAIWISGGFDSDGDLNYEEPYTLFDTSYLFYPESFQVEEGPKLPLPLANHCILQVQYVLTNYSTLQLYYYIGLI